MTDKTLSCTWEDFHAFSAWEHDLNTKKKTKNVKTNNCWDIAYFYFYLSHFSQDFSPSNKCCFVGRLYGELPWGTYPFLALALWSGFLTGYWQGGECLMTTRRQLTDMRIGSRKMHLQCKYIEICGERGGGFSLIYNSWTSLLAWKMLHISSNSFLQRYFCS